MLLKHGANIGDLPRRNHSDQYLSTKAPMVISSRVCARKFDPREYFADQQNSSLDTGLFVIYIFELLTVIMIVALMVFNVRLKSTGEIIFQLMDIPTMRTISMSTYISCGILCPDDLTGELVGNLNHPYERTIEFDITIRNSILRSCMKISNAVNNITVENSSLTLLLYRQKSLTIHSIGDNHLKFREAVWTGIATPNHGIITFYIIRGVLQSLLLSENNNCKLQVGL